MCIIILFKPNFGRIIDCEWKSLLAAKHKIVKPQNFPKYFCFPVWYSQITNEATNTALQCFRSDITVVCKAMEFGQFPLDKHKCYFILTSCKLLLTSVLGWGIQTINYVQPKIEKLSSRVFSLCKQEVMRQLGGG